MSVAATDALSERLRCVTTASELLMPLLFIAFLYQAILGVVIAINESPLQGMTLVIVSFIGAAMFAVEYRTAEVRR